MTTQFHMITTYCISLKTDLAKVIFETSAAEYDKPTYNLVGGLIVSLTMSHPQSFRALFHIECLSGVHVFTHLRECGWKYDSYTPGSMTFPDGHDIQYCIVIIVTTGLEKWVLKLTFLSLWTKKTQNLNVFLKRQCSHFWIWYLTLSNINP